MLFDSYKVLNWLESYSQFYRISASQAHAFKPPITRRFYLDCPVSSYTFKICAFCRRFSLANVFQLTNTHGFLLLALLATKPCLVVLLLLPQKVCHGKIKTIGLIAKNWNFGVQFLRFILELGSNAAKTAGEFRRRMCVLYLCVCVCVFRYARVCVCICCDCCHCCCCCLRSTEKYDK